MTCLQEAGLRCDVIPEFKLVEIFEASVVSDLWFSFSCRKQQTVKIKADVLYCGDLMEQCRCAPVQPPACRRQQSASQQNKSRSFCFERCFLLSVLARRSWRWTRLPPSSRFFCLKERKRSASPKTPRSRMPVCSPWTRRTTRWATSSERKGLTQLTC